MLKLANLKLQAVPGNYDETYTFIYRTWYLSSQQFVFLRTREDWKVHMEAEHVIIHQLVCPLQLLWVQMWEVDWLISVWVSRKPIIWKSEAC